MKQYTHVIALGMGYPSLIELINENARNRYEVVEVDFREGEALMVREAVSRDLTALYYPIPLNRERLE